MGSETSGDGNSSSPAIVVVDGGGVFFSAPRAAIAMYRAGRHFCVCFAGTGGTGFDLMRLDRSGNGSERVRTRAGWTGLERVDVMGLIRWDWVGLACTGSDWIGTDWKWEFGHPTVQCVMATVRTAGPPIAPWFFAFSPFLSFDLLFSSLFPFFVLVFLFFFCCFCNFHCFYFRGVFLFLLSLLFLPQSFTPGRFSFFEKKENKI